MITQDWHDLGIDTRNHSSGDVKTRCPKCAHTRRHTHDLSLSANLDSGLYKCHNPGCGFQGRAGGYDWRDDPTAKVYVQPVVEPDRRLGPNARTFLDDRGIDPAIATELGIYSENNDTTIVFPSTRDGKIVHLKKRKISEKRFWSSPQSEPVFFGLDLCKDAETVVIVEGEMDALSFIAAGHDAVLSVPSGAPSREDASDAKLAYLGSAQKILDDAKRVVIATDNDLPGTVLGDELIRRIGPEKCWRLSWPNGTKDANEALLNYGDTGLMHMLSKAQPVPINGLVYANQIRDHLWETRNGSHRRGIETGYSHFNNFYRVGQGQMTIITGVPSSGKSAFLMAMLTNLARIDPTWNFGIFSPEQFPPEELFKDLVQLRVGKGLTSMNAPDYNAAMDWIQDHFIVESPDRPTLDSILELVRICVLKHGIKGAVIDPYTEVETTRVPGMNESEHIGTQLARIRRFGQLHGCHMWVVAHPTKPDKAKSDAPIGPYDISGSANWYNKADSMLSVYRPTRGAQATPVDVHIQKMRFRDYGHEGIASFGFDMQSGRYYEVPTKDNPTT